ncbi:MAG: hypothetical protein ACYDBX_03105 [Patescibacteria group bacterium]
MPEVMQLTSEQYPVIETESVLKDAEILESTVSLLDQAKTVAFELSREIPFGYYDAIESLIECAKEGDFEVLKFAKRLASEYSHPEPITEIAIVEALAGNLEQAKKTALTIKASRIDRILNLDILDNPRAKTFSEIAIIEAQQDKLHQARQTLSHIQSPYYKVLALIGIYKAGDHEALDQARKIAYSIGESNRLCDPKVEDAKKMALVEIAMANNPEVDNPEVDNPEVSTKAIEIALTIKNDELRISTLIKIAETGDIKALKLAEAATTKVRFLWARDYRLDVVLVEIQLNNIEQAKKITTTMKEMPIAQRVHDAPGRARAAIAIAEVQKGHVEQVREEISTFSPYGAALILAEIALYEAKKGNIDEAKKIVSTIIPCEYKVHALISIANVLRTRLKDKRLLSLHYKQMKSIADQMHSMEI